MIKIEIHAEPDTLESNMAALGYIKQKPVTVNTVWATAEKDATHNSVNEPSDRVVPPATNVPETPLVIDGSKLSAMDGDRERGKAAPGGRRRTNRQIAEDDAYFAHAAKTIVNETGSVPANLPAISAGGERADPDDEPTPEEHAADKARADAEAAMDAADEAKTLDGPTPTIDDLRRAVGDYAKTFDYATAQKRIPEILGCGVVEVPADQLAAKIAAVRAAIANDPPVPSTAKFKPIDPEPEEVHATKDDVLEAITNYGKTFDGTEDRKQWFNSVQDIPKILTKVFGPDVSKPAQIPARPEEYGRALTAINDALAKNPFGRTPK